jgi:uncharacterized protein (TIGR03067 family)
MQRSRLVLVCAFVAVLISTLWWSGLGARAQEKDQEKELAALQGTWRLESYEENGKVVAIQDTVLYVIDKDKWTTKSNGEVKSEGTIIGPYPARSPKHLDVQQATGQTELTIYIRVGDHLIQCGHRDGKTRPSEFATGTPNGGAYLIVLKRQK